MPPLNLPACGNAVALHDDDAVAGPASTGIEKSPRIVPIRPTGCETLPDRSTQSASAQGERTVQSDSTRLAVERAPGSNGDVQVRWRWSRVTEMWREPPFRTHHFDHRQPERNTSCPLTQKSDRPRTAGDVLQRTWRSDAHQHASRVEPETSMMILPSLVGLTVYGHWRRSLEPHKSRSTGVVSVVVAAVVSIT